MSEEISGYWSKNDTQKLRELYESNVPLAEICTVLKRSKKSVLNKIDHSNIHRTVKSAT